MFRAAIVVLLAVGIILLARHWPFSPDRVVQSLQEDFHGAV
jgi:hypothetical protein